MALAVQISDFFIVKDAYSSDTDFAYLIKTTNFDLSLGLVSFGGINDEAIDGSLRTNIRGYRATLDLPHEKLLTSTFKRTTFATTGNLNTFSNNFTNKVSDFSDSSISQFFTDMITIFKTNGDTHVVLSLDGNVPSLPPAQTEYMDFIIDSSSFKTTFTNQIGRDSGNIKLIGQKILTTIPTEYQAT
tara:strand:+ start:147 stop:707 length:561 start_codon:yes stop_codon:yes gene_type:complete